MKLKLLATAISSTLLIGCGSDDSLPKVTEGTYYNATPLTIGEFTNVTINSGEQLEAFKVTVPSTGSNRTITTVIDIVEPTPYAEFWYQDKSVLFGQLMPEQDIHDAVNRDDADPDSLLYISEAFRTPFLEPQDTIIEQAFATFDDEGVAQPFSTTDETFYFYVRSPEYSIQPTLTNAIESLSYPIELRVGVFEQSQDAFCSDEEDGIQCITEAPHENYHCGLIDGQGELGACEGIVTFEPVSAISGKDTVSVVEQWPNASEPNMAVFSGNGTVGLDPVWMVNNFPENSQFYLSSNNSPEVTFYADTVGEYEITLTVINEIGRPSTATHVINVVADSDGDGIVDGEDPDADGDGYVGAEDLFPNDKASHRDSDGDGVSNYAQEDEDGDGIVDYLDAYPFDPERTSFEEYVEPANERFTNDGILISEKTGLTAPLTISGQFNDEVGFDQDFYEINIPEGRYTINVSTSGEYTPVLSVIESNGTPLPSRDLNAESSTYDASYTVLVPSDGLYYLVATSEVSDKVDYSLNVVIDSDQDGVSDDVEIALDSNELNPDTDGDQIPDGTEISQAEKSLSDVDGDGIPSWWDLESDGDNIADAFESRIRFPQNSDKDNSANFVDTDSDGNGISDQVEAGSNPLSPVDTDNDGVPDIYDIDNDNDGLHDIIDDDSLTARLPEPDPTFTPEAFGIKRISYPNFTSSNQCEVGGNAVIEVVNTPTSASVTVLLKNDGEATEVDYEIIDGNYVIECTEAMLGRANLAVTAGGLISGNYGINVVPVGSMVLDSVEYDNGRVTLSGNNLNQPYSIVSENFTQGVNNSANDSASFDSVLLNEGYEDGEAAIVVNGDVVATFFIRAFDDKRSVTIDSALPLNAGSSLTIDTGFGTDFNVEQGSTVVDINSLSAERIYVLETVTTSDGERTYWVGGGISAPWMESLELTPETLALSLMLESIPVDLSLTENKSVYEELLELDEVVKLGLHLTEALENDSDYLSGFDVYTTNVYGDALEAVTTTASVSVAAISSDFDFDPGEVDDIKVKSQSGDVKIENDTRSYLAVQAVDRNGEVLEDGYSVNTMWDANMVSPQFGFFQIAKEGDVYKKVRSSTVNVLTAGFDVEHAPLVSNSMLKDEQKGVKRLINIRTITDEVYVPLVVELLSTGLKVSKVDKNKVRDFLLAHGNFLISETAETLGDGQNLDSLLGDIFDAFIALGTDTALIAKIADEYNISIGKVTAKWSLRSVPVLGQLLAAKDIAALSGSAISIGKALYDFYTIDGSIDFTHEAEIKLISIDPSVVSPDFQPVNVAIQGEGMEPYKDNYLSISTYRPRLMLLKGGDTEEVGSYTLHDITNGGTEAKLTLPGKLFQEDNVVYDAYLYFDDSRTEEKSEILTNALEVKDDLVITSISQPTAYINQRISINGSGFDRNPERNVIRIGGEEVRVLSAYKDSVFFSLPSTFADGTYEVFVEKLDAQGEVVEQSNSIQLIVASSSTVIRVCDNGSAKDDNFSLTVNGFYAGTTETSRFRPCKDFNVSLGLGANTVILAGIEAPDGIGTYSIEFPSNVRLASNSSPLSGDDLTPDVPPKQYTVYLDSIEPQAVLFNDKAPKVVYEE
jgi:hypothetical protein